MLPFLLAQLFAPPIQQGPVRLPSETINLPSPSSPAGQPPLDLQPDVETIPPGQTPESDQNNSTTVPKSGETEPTILPALKGKIPYSKTKLKKLLTPCLNHAEISQQLEACATLLSERLISDGYINSRVIAVLDANIPHLELLRGSLAEIRVRSDNSKLQDRVTYLLRHLKGTTLWLPSIQNNLFLIKRLPGVGSVKGSLNRLGDDSSKAVLSIEVIPGKKPWQGDFALRNDGSQGAGEYRATGALIKNDLALTGDSLLLYGELNWTEQPQLGSSNTSISYTIPFNPTLSFTGSYGYGTNSSPEFDVPGIDLSSDQNQGYGQFDYTFYETIDQRWGIFAGYSLNRNTADLSLAGLGTFSATEKSSYLRLGVSGNGNQWPASWNGSLYLLQALSSNLISASSATAIGAQAGTSWAFAPSWQLNARVAGQLAMNDLPSSMWFSIGSDTGLRGLPGQLFSVQEGWLSTVELAWTFWQNKTQSLQLVPFIGAGGGSNPGFNDTVGSGGILTRWQVGSNWAFELGWVHQFSTNDNLGVWNDWILDDGLYTRIQFRF